MAMDYAAIITTVDQVSEAATAMVARLVRDGFTEAQARAITTGIFASMANPNDDDAEEN